MSKRAVSGRRAGYFKSLVEEDAVTEDDDSGAEERLEVGEVLEEGVMIL